MSDTHERSAYFRGRRLLDSREKPDSSLTASSIHVTVTFLTAEQANLFLTDSYIQLIRK